MDRYQTTFETWNKVAALYQEKFMDLDLYNDTYDIFYRFLNNEQANILEVGCGPGNISRYLISRSPDLKIIGIDIAPNMIELAKQNNPTADFKIMDCRNLDAIQEKFDGIIVGFCIPYLSMEDNYKLIKDCAHKLTKNGILYFSTIKGDYDQSGFEKGSTGDSAYVYYYNETFFQTELEKNGFTLLNLVEKEFPKADGTNMINQIFIAVID